MDHKDEAWVAIEVDLAQYDACFRGNEHPHPSLPTRQWLLPAAVVNEFPRWEVPLVEVLKLRLDRSCPYHCSYVKLKRLIKSGTWGATRERWLTALHQGRLLLA